MSKIYYNSSGTKFEVFKVTLDNCEKALEWLLKNNLAINLVRLKNIIQLVPRLESESYLFEGNPTMREVTEDNPVYITRDVITNSVGVSSSEDFLNYRWREEHYLMQLFQYKHLPEHLQEISKPICELAKKLDSILPNNPEKTTALRKLRECKDCAVTARLFK